MAEYISCRNCDSAYCEGCNIYTLATMLQEGKFDCLMDENFSVNRFADVAPVVHGEWVVDDYDSGDPGYYAAFIEVHCSKCGYESGAESGQYGWAYGDPFPLSYCPNCGVKMDGERKGE